MPEENIWDLLHRIDTLVDLFKKETRRLPSATEVADHPTCQEIVAMGWPMVTELIRRYYQTESWRWGIPLTQIVGTDHADGAKDAKGAAKSWVRWARSGPADAPAKYREDLCKLCTCSGEQVLYGGCICSASSPFRSMGERLRLGLIKLQAGIR